MGRNYFCIKISESIYALYFVCIDDKVHPGRMRCIQQRFSSPAQQPIHVSTAKSYHRIFSATAPSSPHQKSITHQHRFQQSLTQRGDTSSGRKHGSISPTMQMGSRSALHRRWINGSVGVVGKQAKQRQEEKGHQRSVWPSLSLV